MGKYRLVRMNAVKYTDDEFVLEQLLDEGYILEPVLEPDEEPTDGAGGVDDKEPDEEPTDGAGGVDDKEPDEEPTDGGKKSTKSSKK